MNIEDYTLLHQIAANLLKINSQLGEFNKNYRAVHNIYGDETKIMKVPAGDGSIPADLADEKKGFLQLNLFDDLSDDAKYVRELPIYNVLKMRACNGIRIYLASRNRKRGDKDPYKQLNEIFVKDILDVDIKEMLTYRSFGVVSATQIQALINRANKKRVIIDQL